jgi:hypothetical protein
MPPGEELAARTLVIDVAGWGFPLRVPHDLIAMTRASGPPIDRGDVIALTTAQRDATRRP